MQEITPGDPVAVFIKRRILSKNGEYPFLGAGPKIERLRIEEAVAQMTGPAEAGPVCRDLSDCALPALLPALFSRHHVFEEILVLRGEALRESQNLKAVGIADGPELDIG